MKIVIDIHEEDWEFIKESDGCRWSRAIIEGVINGTPLPEHHGRLIDADEIQFENTEFDTYSDYSRAFDAIDQADTIIEADKEK